jgi:hypothetical protein
MKWKSVSLAAVAMFGLTAGALAQQPTLSARRSLAATPPARPSLFSQISWWAKFGQPVEPAVEAAPSGEAHVVHDHGYGFGYVYGPGSCDCRPACTDQLWAGYEQMPWRCSHPQYKERYRGFCGHGGCGHGGCGHGRCGHVSDCGCTVSAPACEAAPSCTESVCCKPKCKRCKQWFAHWSWGKKCCDTCDSCSAPIGCGCATPIGHGPPAADAPAASPPLPTADEASIQKKPLLRRVSTQQTIQRPSATR